MRAVWPQHLPMSVRISAHDWVEGGITPDDAVTIARAFKAAGADMIDCSSGQVSKKEKPVYGRMFQTPFADRIRNEAGIATIAVGAISEADHVNSIIAAGRADLCAVARPHLANPAWTLTEAAKIGYPDLQWPKQYRAAKVQLERNLERERAMAGGSGGWPQQANRALGVLSMMRLTRTGMQLVTGGGARHRGGDRATASRPKAARVTLMGRRLRCARSRSRRELPGSGHAAIAVDVSDAASIEQGFAQARERLRAGRHPRQQRRPGRERAVRQDRR